ncbi:YrvL family regulatory protein [Oceanobacillus locisalsi]|uniref:YrvL family regulatory protein n=1 Tax=Oceanobacillus locisalsi TaxID=546107 RepID=A0ABW3NKD8_9BACI
MKEKTKNIIGMTLLIIFLMGIIAAIYFFGITGIFVILGVQYQSIWSLIIFVMSVFILGLVVDVFTGAIAKLTVEILSGKIKPMVIEFLFGFATNWIVIMTVDAFMSSLNLSLETKFIFSLILTFFELVFQDKNIS